MLTLLTSGWISAFVTNHCKNFSVSTPRTHPVGVIGRAEVRGAHDFQHL